MGPFSKSQILLTFCLLGLGALNPPNALASSKLSTPHVELELVSNAKSIQPGTPLNLGLNFKIIPGWHIYWKNPGDSGEALKVKWESPPTVSIGPLEFPFPQRIEIPPLVNYGYEGEVMVLARVQPDAKLKSGETLPLRAQATWLVCQEICIPEQGMVELHLPVKDTTPQANEAWAGRFEKSIAKLPKKILSRNSKFSAEDGTLWLSLAKTDEFSPDPNAKYAFFPIRPGEIENAASQETKITGEHVKLGLKKSNLTPGPLAHLQGVVVAQAPGQAGRAYFVDASPSRPIPLGKILLFAFLGGLLLNLMPCVFPVLSLKILSFVKKSGEHPERIRRHGLIYALGVLLSFWVLAGILLLVRLGGEQVGWGFHLQSPVFLIVLAYLIFLLGISLLGWFPFGASLMGFGSSWAGQKGYRGTFFTGVLATVVATPCVAPFMGPAIGIALTQNNLSSFLIFTGMGLGLSFPYWVLTNLPGALKKLPRPGPWMETFKQAMAFLLFATVLWLLWIFSLQTGSTSVIWFLGGLLVLSFGVWLRSRLASPDARRFLRVASLLIPGILILSGFGMGIWGIEAAPRTGAPTTNADGSGISWLPYSPETLRQWRSQDKAVFINFTAAWCITCQVNEKLVFQTKEVEDEFKKRGVILLKADWTQKDEVISQALADYGRQGVPLYVLYPPGANSRPELLPELLTKKMVVNALEKI